MQNSSGFCIKKATETVAFLNYLESLEAASLSTTI